MAGDSAALLNTTEHGASPICLMTAPVIPGQPLLINRPVRTSCLDVIGRFGDFLQHIPMLHDFAALQPGDVHNGHPAVALTQHVPK